MTQPLYFTNALLVLPNEIIDGSLLVTDGHIAALEGPAPTGAEEIDCAGDYLIPGLVELHTDNLERYLQPRPGVDWPRRAAVAAHDGELTSVGITTVLDAVRIGIMRHDSDVGDYARDVAEATDALRKHGLLRADHFMHLRCEICSDGVLEEFDAIADHPAVRLISLMDHTPGQRQFAKIEKYCEYYQGKHGLSDEQLEEFLQYSRDMQEKNAIPHREGLVERAQQRGFCIASHDDASAAHVDEAIEAKVTVAEFPTTEEAAAASREAGFKILMGGPNLLRGKSHSGNVSAGALAEKHLLDIVSSDYAPSSLMMAAFKLGEESTTFDLPAAIRTVTKTPAESVGLKDRGAIEVGRRADLVRVHRAERLCVARGVWREGQRVA